MRSKALVLLAVLPAMLAHADETKTMPEAAKRAVVDILAHDPGVARTYQLCPADAFNKQAPWSALLRRPPTTPVAVCTAAPDRCLAGCLATHDGGACYGLARAFQVEDGDTALPARKLFSLGCAAGSGTACTNRASLIRNFNAPDDPFYDKPKSVQSDCEARSFRIACRQGDAWGCSMLGQAYQYGEGVAQDRGYARTLFDKACSYNPAFAACDYARGQRRLLDEAAPAPRP